jgi:hypothetical protein
MSGNTGGIRVDPDWIAGYADTVAQAGADLAAALRTLDGAPLSGASFGDLGRAAGAPAAYARASGALRTQLATAAAALTAAAADLRTAAAAHTGADTAHATTIRRTAHP